MNGEGRKKLAEILDSLSKEDISVERRLARMEARQMLYFGNGNEGICDERRKLIAKLSDKVNSISLKIATLFGGLAVLVIVFQLLGPKIAEKLFGG